MAEQRSYRSDPINADMVIAQLSRKVLNLETQVAGLNARVEVLQRSAQAADSLRNTANLLRCKIVDTGLHETPRTSEPAAFSGRYAGFSFRNSGQPAQAGAHERAAAAPSEPVAPLWALELQATCAKQHTRIRELELQLALSSRSLESGPASSATPPPGAPGGNSGAAGGTGGAPTPHSRSPATSGKVHTPHTDRVASSAARLAAASRGGGAAQPPPSSASWQPSQAPASSAVHTSSTHAAQWPAHNLFASSAATPFVDSVNQGPTSTRDFLSSSQRFQHTGTAKHF